jgi:hypothetical protein
VISVRDFRPFGKLLDEEIPAYLLQLKQPSFLTINYRHFWKRELAHAHYKFGLFEIAAERSSASAGNFARSPWPARIPHQTPTNGQSHLLERLRDQTLQRLNK